MTGPHVYKNLAEFAALSAAGVVTEVTDAAGLAATASRVMENSGKLSRLAAAARDHARQAGKRPDFAADSCLELIDRAGSTS